MKSMASMPAWSVNNTLMIGIASVVAMIANVDGGLIERDCGGRVEVVLGLN